MGHATGWLQRFRQFKNKIKKWKPGNSPCRLCKVYIDNIGFVWDKRETWNVQ